MILIHGGRINNVIKVSICVCVSVLLILMYTSNFETDYQCIKTSCNIFAQIGGIKLASSSERSQPPDLTLNFYLILFHFFKMNGTKPSTKLATVNSDYKTLKMKLINFKIILAQIDGNSKLSTPFKIILVPSSHQFQLHTHLQGLTSDKLLVHC